MIIEWEGLQPDETRRWYRHLYGIRGTVWAVRGVYVRDYFIAEECMDEGLREYLPGTVYSIACVIESELSAAVGAPMSDALKERWNELFMRPAPEVTPHV